MIEILELGRFDYRETKHETQRAENVSIQIFVIVKVPRLDWIKPSSSVHTKQAAYTLHLSASQLSVRVNFVAYGLLLSPASCSG